MRILFLAHRLPYPPNKGDKVRSFWELRALAARHEVDLFCFYDDPADEEHLGMLGRYCRTWYAQKIPFVQSRFRALVCAAAGRSFSLGYFHSPAMARRIREAMRSRAYELIFVYSSSMAQYVTGCGATARVLDMVDVDSLKWEAYARRARPPYSWLWQREARSLAEFERQAIEQFSLTLVCTDSEAELLKRESSGQKIVALAHPVDLEYFDPGATPLPPEIAAWQPYLVFTGSMDYYPNVDGVLHFYNDVFPLLRSQAPNVRLVIVGRNPAREIRRLMVDSAVHVTGSVPDVRPYLRGAAAAIVPLRIARGLQNKLIEAMAMGLPVAASRLAASALPSRLSSLLIAEDNPQRLCERLVTLLHNGSSFSSTAVRQAVAEHFDGAGLTQTLEELVANVRAQHAAAMGAEQAGSGSAVKIAFSKRNDTEDAALKTIRNTGRV